jgi:glycosyltransferase involved in cell wall biosynthesis
VVIRPFPVLRKALLSPSGTLRLFGHTCWALPRLIRLLRQHRPAVVYVNTLTIPVWLAAGRLVRTSVICHVHEAEEAVNPFIRRALVLPLLLANRVLTNSRSSRDTLERAGFRRAGRAQVVYNGVPGPPEITPLTTTQPGKLVVVGRLSPRKGTDIAIRATLMLHEQGFSVSLTLVGGVFSAYEWFETQLRGMAAGWPVRFAGIQNPVLPWLAEADIVVVPSRWSRSATQRSKGCWPADRWSPAACRDSRRSCVPTRRVCWSPRRSGRPCSGHRYASRRLAPCQSASGGRSARCARSFQPGPLSSRDPGCSGGGWLRGHY